MTYTLDPRVVRVRVDLAKGSHFVRDGRKKKQKMAWARKLKRERERDRAEDSGTVREKKDG